jgi:hypothetical protein
MGGRKTYTLGCIDCIILDRDYQDIEWWRALVSTVRVLYDIGILAHLHGVLVVLLGRTSY